MSDTKSPSNPRISVTIPVTLPPGYRIVNNCVEIDPVQAKRIVALFREYVRSR